MTGSRRSPSPRVSRSSSRWGPTREMPRSSSSLRRVGDGVEQRAACEGLDHRRPGRCWPCSRGRRRRGSPRGRRPRRPCRRRGAGRRPAAGGRRAARRRRGRGCSSQISSVDMAASRDEPRAMAGGLEQAVALPEDPVVVGPDAGQPGRAQDRGGRRGTCAGPTGSPLTRVRSSGAKTTVRTRPMISRGRGRGDRLIRARLARPGVELDLEQRRTTLLHDRRADDRLVGPALTSGASVATRCEERRER